MKRPLVVLCAAAATLFAATAAEAGGVSWSVGVNVPPVATYVSGGPAWYPAPVRYAPQVVYAPRVHRRPHYWVAPAPRWHRGWDRHDRWHHDGGHRR